LCIVSYIFRIQYLYISKVDKGMIVIQYIKAICFTNKIIFGNRHAYKYNAIALSTYVDSNDNKTVLLSNNQLIYSLGGLAKMVCKQGAGNNSNSSASQAISLRANND